MTLEELNSVLKIVNNDLREYITTDDSATNDAIANGFFTVKDFQNGIKFLLKNHFDYQGLIPKGLAIAVTKENNPYNATEE